MIYDRYNPCAHHHPGRTHLRTLHLIRVDQLCVPTRPIFEHEMAINKEATEYTDVVKKLVIRELNKSSV
jgi:hypothetical protein